MNQRNAFAFYAGTRLKWITKTPGCYLSFYLHSQGKCMKGTLQVTIRIAVYLHLSNNYFCHFFRFVQEAAEDS